MAELKTKPTPAKVEAFLSAIEPPQKQADARAICALMERVSGEPPVMWGPSIVGFGKYHYRYASGHEGDAPRLGFSPRKAALTLYVWGALLERPELLERVGKATAGKGCLYVKRLSDVDVPVLEEMMAHAYAWAGTMHRD